MYFQGLVSFNGGYLGLRLVFLLEQVKAERAADKKDVVKAEKAAAAKFRAERQEAIEAMKEHKERVAKLKAVIKAEKAKIKEVCQIPPSLACFLNLFVSLGLLLFCSFVFFGVSFK